MQNSGVFSGLSDGVRKTIVTGLAPAKPMPKPAAKPVSTHRRGGHAKHTRKGK